MMFSKQLTRWTVSLFGLVAVVGIGLICYANTLPVYSDAQAPGRLSSELSNLPREVRFARWYSELQQYETPHKKYFDLGCGLIALGVAGIVSLKIVSVFLNTELPPRAFPMLMAFWIGAWLVNIPASMFYYYVRYKRFDFPTWGDSVVIPVVQETVAWVIGCVVTSILLIVLAKGSFFDSRSATVHSKFFGIWIKKAIIALWMIILLVSVITGIPYGDVGAVSSCLLGASLLFVVLKTIVNNVSQTKPLIER